jgi:hypothetical protein
LTEENNVGPSGYHYHVSGEFTTTDDANLVGFLEMAFPIYGRKDKDGTYPTNLDAYGGHLLQQIFRLEFITTTVRMLIT